MKLKRTLGRVGLALGSTLLALIAVEIGLRVMHREPERFAHPWHFEAADKRIALDMYPDDPRGYFPIDLRDDAERARWRNQFPGVEQHYRHTPFGVPLRFSAELCRGGDIAPK